MAKKPDLELLTSMTMALANEPAVERLSEKHPVRIMIQAMLKEHGVRTPYPPVER